MYRLVYLSTATVRFSDEELEKLLIIARENNDPLNVTGLLILKGRSFLQCLEGPKESVLQIFSKIEKDERHNAIVKVIEEEDNERYFPNWSMGYKNFNHMDAVSSQKLIDFSKADHIENLSSDFISEIFKEFIEAK